MTKFGMTTCVFNPCVFRTTRLNGLKMEMRDVHSEPPAECMDAYIAYVEDEAYHSTPCPARYREIMGDIRVLATDPLVRKDTVSCGPITAGVANAVFGLCRYLRNYKFLTVASASSAGSEGGRDASVPDGGEEEAISVDELASRFGGIYQSSAERMGKDGGLGSGKDGLRDGKKKERKWPGQGRENRLPGAVGKESQAIGVSRKDRKIGGKGKGGKSVISSLLCSKMRRDKLSDGRASSGGMDGGPNGGQRGNEAVGRVCDGVGKMRLC